VSLALIGLRGPGSQRNENDGVVVSEPVSISTGIAARYATALFELARDGGTLPALEADTAALAAVLGDSADLRAMIASPILARAEQEAAILAIARKMGLSDLTANTLRLMAGNRRLFALPQLVVRLAAMIADHKGEVTAEVTAAKALTKAQADALAAALKTSTGRDVKLNVTVDAALIGGLVVKVGSKMIDTSIRTKLDQLQNTMKEVG
jgi:F-type H+-transporting ATPase subunit delta